MRTFSERLERCIVQGDLTISDLARWFERPRPTVDTWVNGRTPFGPAARRANHRLELLEEHVRNKRGFPVPANLAWKNREAYIKGLRDDAERYSRVPNMRPAG